MAHVLRLSQIDLASVLAQPSPQIDLKLEVYENSTRNFLKAVAKYKNRAISTISDRRTSQATDKKKMLEKAQAIELETNQFKLREIELVAELEREKVERRDAELSVAAFKRQSASLRERCASIDAEIEQYRVIAANLQREKNMEHSTLGIHASYISPELDLCERHLSCIVEGVETDRLLVRFCQVDRYEPEREFSFVIDISDRSYKVLTSSHILTSLPILVDSLNNSQDIYGFIKRVRVAYEDQVRSKVRTTI